ncbi:L,D-transpeptidase [Allocoleopsis sp.]|uniref:L,D-transpeptidase n=1 Tax=Allocoleopsis sp. TaxID=3088169 RepID=UPI002FD34441
MNSIMSLQWLRRSGKFLAGAVLTLTAFGIWVVPTYSTPVGELIAKKMMELEASQERWIQIDLKNQRLIAWEGGTQVYAIVISTGKGSTPTRPGIFNIQTKLAKSRMRGADYDVPNVPYVMFYEGNYAIHGAFWHRRFGTPVSHGCVNVAVNHARWLFDWASVGTPVVIND